MIQIILISLVTTLVGCVIGYLITKLLVSLFRKQSNKTINIEYFYNIFGFYYEDVIKYAPELDTLISSQLHPGLKDNVNIKMIRLLGINDAINIAEQIDIIKVKQALENIKNQKALENIDG